MADKFQIGEKADSVFEVLRLLDYNDFVYHRDGDTFVLCFEDKGMKWETDMICRDDGVLIYGVYPFSVRDREKARTLCGTVNGQALYGAMIIVEGDELSPTGCRLVFRTGADLFDAYSAYEMIGRSLEYNAGVITRFWEEAQKC